jgi:hypothetical protein
MATYAATTKFGSGYTDEVGGIVQTVGAAWSLPSVVLGTADILEGPVVPRNARILGVVLCATDCDGSGTPALTLDVGDASDDNRLVAAATIGQAGGVSTALVPATGVGYKYTAPTTILVSAAAASAASSTTTQMISLMVQYIVEEETS